MTSPIEQDTYANVALLTQQVSVTDSASMKFIELTAPSSRQLAVLLASHPGAKVVARRESNPTEDTAAVTLLVEATEPTTRGGLSGDPRVRQGDGIPVAVVLAPDQPAPVIEMRTHGFQLRGEAVNLVRQRALAAARDGLHLLLATTGGSIAHGGAQAEVTFSDCRMNDGIYIVSCSITTTADFSPSRGARQLGLL